MSWMRKPNWRLSVAAISIGVICNMDLRGGPMGLSDPSFDSPRFTARCYPSYVFGDGRGGLLWSFVNSYLNDFVGANGVRVGGLVRTTVDGVLDTNFVVGPALQGAFGVAVQGDGKVLVGARLIGDLAANGAANYRVVRVLTNGTLDTSYYSPVFGGGPRFITPLAAGGLLAAWNDLAGTVEANGGISGVVRLNPEGALDVTFAPPALAGGSGLGVFALPVVATNGDIYLAGGFKSVNGQSRLGVARFVPSGSLDPGFVPSGYTFSTAIRDVLLQPDGKVVIAGRLRVNTNGTPSAEYFPLLRLNSDGSLDPSFNLVPNDSINFSFARHLGTTPDGKLLTISTSMARFNSDGSLDTNFTQLPFGDALGNPSSDYDPHECYWFSQLSDGRIVIPSNPAVSGAETIGGKPFNGAVRLLPDGKLDETFCQPVFQQDIFPTVVSRQSNGSLLVGGTFDHVGANAMLRLARLSTNGVPDSSYKCASSDVGTVLNMITLPSDKIHALLEMVDLSSFSVSNVLFRLQPDGAEDSGFRADPASINAGEEFSTDLLLQGQQPVLVGSRAQAFIYGANIPILRLLENGERDPDFGLNLPMPGGGNYWDGSPITEWDRVYLYEIGELFLGDAQLLTTVADGKIIAALGDVPSGDISVYRITRLNTNGTKDASFTEITVSAGGSYACAPTVHDRFWSDGWVSATYPLRCIAGATMQSNGTIFVYGTFTNVDGTRRAGIVRLSSASTVDPTFPVGAGPVTAGGLGSVKINSLSVDGTGKVWVSGNFVQWDGFNAPGYVRLNADGSVDVACRPTISHYPLESDYSSVVGGALPGAAGDAFAFGPHLAPGEEWPRAISRLVAYPPPALKPLGLWSGLGFGLAFDTLAGVTYRLETSADLKTWQSWIAIKGTGGTVFTNDPTVINPPQRFYRALYEQ